MFFESKSNTKNSLPAQWQSCLSDLAFMYLLNVISPSVQFWIFKKVKCTDSTAGKIIHLTKFSLNNLITLVPFYFVVSFICIYTFINFVMQFIKLTKNYKTNFPSRELIHFHNSCT